MPLPPPRAPIRHIRSRRHGSNHAPWFTSQAMLRFSGKSRENDDNPTELYVTSDFVLPGEIVAPRYGGSLRSDNDFIAVYENPDMLHVDHVEADY